MAKTTAILLTRPDEKTGWKLEFRENVHEAYQEYKEIYLAGKLDVELWSSSQGRIAKRHASAPQINPEAIKPVEEQEGTNDFKAAQEKIAAKAKKKGARKKTEPAPETDETKTE